jgi:predicted dehydrogenase
LFLMEAIWSRFVPVMEDVRAWLTAGEIGEIRMLTADMGFQFQHEDLTTRHYNRLLGGGSLLDLGVYMISFATSVLGNEPVEIHGNALVGTSGVDEQASISLRFPGGQLASLMVSFLAESPHDACIIGTKGMIRIPCVANGASTATLVREYKLTGEHTTTEVASRKVAGFGYQYEAAEVMRCLRAGLTESPLMPLDETLAIARIMDALRKQWQLVFPGDDA